MDTSDIIAIWKSHGWNNAQDYLNQCPFDTPRIEQFDPDTIPAKTFWQAADKIFSTNPVANLPSKVLDISQSNSTNHNIAFWSGMIGQTELARVNAEHRFGFANFAEIGCGYGSFLRHYIEKCQTNVQYTGFDVVLRLDGTQEIEGKDGTFSKDQIEKHKEEFNIFYSANVFQHLSPNQIKKYLSQMYQMLPYGGYANIMYVHDTDSTYHYGQVVKIISESAFMKLVKAVGFSVVGFTKIYTGPALCPFSVLLEK